MNDKAISILQEARVRLVKEIEEIDRSIAQLQGQSFAPRPTNGTPKPSTITPGQYSGIEIATALQAYLVERGRVAVPLKEAIRDLADAGTKTIAKYADDPEGQARKYLTITIRNNKKIFGFDKAKDEVWLAAGQKSA